VLSSPSATWRRIVTASIACSRAAVNRLPLGVPLVGMFQAASGELDLVTSMLGASIVGDFAGSERGHTFDLRWVGPRRSADHRFQQACGLVGAQPSAQSLTQMYG
jgi:hypothetical protein